MVTRDTKTRLENDWKVADNSEENVREDEDAEVDHHAASQANRVRQSDSQKKNLKEIARKLWLAVEVGDKLGSL